MSPAAGSGKAKEKDKDGGGVAAVERALAIVAAVEAAAAPISLAELSRETGLYKSTILRLLVTLEDNGYVTRLGDGHYDLGPAAFRLGAAFERKNTLQHHVLPVLQQLVAQGTESPSFHVRQDHDSRLCLLRVNSNHSTLDRIEAGSAYPLRAGAAGQVILAFNGERGARYDAIRSEGWALSLGERDPSCAAVAAPVFGPDSRLLGALSLSGPRERFGDDEIDALRRALGAAAAKLTRALGGAWPPFTAPAETAVRSARRRER
ncbi:MAG: IclR family transcriptional regulator C-terminal domain-containing protein [Pseudomonadota bacterium]